MNLFTRVDNYRRKLTQSESRILTYATETYPQGVLGPARTIAEKVGVSTATVVRFFGKLGYKSYAELQGEARAEVTAKLSSPLARAYFSESDASSVAAVFNGTYATDVSNLTRTYKTNRAADFQKLVDFLLQPGRGRLYLMGTKNSSAVVQYLFANLNLCLTDVIHLSGDDGALADAMVRASSRDVLFVVSIRRYAHNTIRVSRYFKELGAKIVCITDRKDSPVAQIADSSLFVDLASLSPFDSFTAAFSLCNAVVGAVVAKRRKEVESALANGEKVWRFLQVFEE